MCHTSPSTYLLWSVLSSTLFVFLVVHLWSFDRFRCLKWHTHGSSGAFKRFMTYTYLLTTPLLVVFSVCFAMIKYSEGYVDLPLLGIIPKPYTLWTPGHRRLIIPLQVIFSFAWAFEIVTHLEELCFWSFLLASTGSSTDLKWFRSLHFRFWCTGSLLSVIGIPLTTILHRENPLMAEAWLFVVASSCSLMLTLLFVPVLVMFPSFLRRLKSEGAQQRVVLRLCLFHDLNIIRVAFRFFFVLPFLALGIDGVRPTPVLNESLLWTDLLATLGSIGCITSSVLTLLIFFPRNLEAEAGYASKSSRVGGTSSFHASEKRTTWRQYPPSQYTAPTAPDAVEMPWDGRSNPSLARAYVAQRGALFELYEAAELDKLSHHPYAPRSNLEMDTLGDENDDEKVMDFSRTAQDVQEQTPPRSHESLHPLASRPPPARTLSLPPRLSSATAAQWRANKPYLTASRPVHGAHARFGGVSLPRDVALNEQGAVHPLVRSYVSPIDIMNSY